MPRNSSLRYSQTRPEVVQRLVELLQQPQPEVLRLPSFRPLPGRERQTSPPPPLPSPDQPPESDQPPQP